MVLVFILYFSFYGISRHQAFLSEYYDMGIMDQTVYNTSKGRILQMTDPAGFQSINRLVIHGDVILALLAPLYWIYSGPETLIILQVLIVALGSIFVYLLTKEILGSNKIGLLLAFLYLMYPPLQWSVIFDFHAVTLSTTFLLALFYFWKKEKYLFSAIFFLLTIFSKEQVAVTITLMAIYFILSKRGDRRFNFAVFGLSIFWLLAVFFWLIPYFRQGQHFALVRYKYIGASLSSIMIIIQKLFSTNSLDYFWLILSPLSLLPIFSPVILLALPDLVINLLSSNTNMQSVIYHYTAVNTPILFLSLIYSLQFIQEKKKMAIKYLLIILLMATFFTSWKYSPLPYSKWADMRPFQNRLAETNDIELWTRILSDENISVAASGSLAPHFSRRKTLIRFSSNYIKGDYVVLLRNKVLDDWYDKKGSIDAYNLLKKDPNFKLVYGRLNLEIYKKI